MDTARNATIIAAALAALSLTACSTGGDAEPGETVTVTEGATSGGAGPEGGGSTGGGEGGEATPEGDATGDPAAGGVNSGGGSDRGGSDTQGEESMGAVGDVTPGSDDYVDPDWEALPEYKDAVGMAEAVGSDYWGSDPDVPEWDCTKDYQQTLKVRDMMTGDVEKATTLECVNKVGEFVVLTVADPSWKDADISLMCDPEIMDPNCFAINGWMVEADNRPSLVEVLDRVGVDGERWGLAPVN